MEIKPNRATEVLPKKTKNISLNCTTCSKNVAYITAADCDVNDDDAVRDNFYCQSCYDKKYPNPGNCLRCNRELLGVSRHSMGENVICASCYNEKEEPPIGGMHCIVCNEMRPQDSICHYCYEGVKNDARRAEEEYAKLLAKIIYKNEPPFYCAANIDQVPEDAFGKEWELSNGKNWLTRTLHGKTNHIIYRFKDTEGVTWAFMRPVQQKPVKRMSREDVIQMLSKEDFYCIIKNNNTAESYVGEKLGREVVIDGDS